MLKHKIKTQQSNTLRDGDLALQTNRACHTAVDI